MPQQQFDERRPLNVNGQMDDSTATGSYTLGIGDQGRDWRLDRFFITNSDSIPHHLYADPQGGGGGGFLAELTIPARAGFDGNVPFDVLGFLFSSAEQFFLMREGNPWQFQLIEAIGSGQIMNFTMFGGEY